MTEDYIDVYGGYAIKLLRHVHLLPQPSRATSGEKIPNAIAHDRALFDGNFEFRRRRQKQIRIGLRMFNLISRDDRHVLFGIFSMSRTGRALSIRPLVAIAKEPSHRSKI